MLRKQKEMKAETIAKCHDGEGDLFCRTVLAGADIGGITFMHDDVLEPGTSIGEHPHDGHEEIYYVVDGSGQMILDGKQYPVGAGDVSVVRRGHSHGIINSPDSKMRLIVVGIETNPV